MAFWPLNPHSALHQNEVGTLASSWPPTATVTAGAANVKGAYTTLHASTAVEWDGFWINLPQTYVAATNTSSLMDIAFGAAASEVIQIADMPVGYRSSQSSTSGIAIYIPLRVPAGTRISARLQSAVASKAIAMRIVGNYGYSLVGPGFPSYNEAITYGTTAASSLGVVVTSGAANTLGSWAQIAATVSNDIKAILLGVQGNAATVLSASTGRLQLGIGAAASEQQIGPDFYLACSASEFITYDNPSFGFIIPLYGLQIPASSRLSARWASSSATQALDVSVIGFR